MGSFKQQLSRVSPLTIALIILFAAAMTYLVIRAFAASGVATLYTSPGGTQSVTTGQSFTVNVRISTGGNVPVTGASVYLSYPTNRLQVIGESYAGSPYSTQLVASDSGGVLRMDRAAFPMISGGDQLFAQVTFKALTAGSTAISFTSNSVVTSGEDDSNILSARNGVTYNIAAPTTPPPSSGGGSSPGGGGSSGSSGGSSSGGSRPVTGGSKPSSSSASSGSGTTSGGSSSSNANSGNTGSSNASGGSSQTGSETTAAGDEATSALLVTIVDSHNKPVAGAEVTIGGQTVKTDKNGIARFSGVPAGNQAVAVKYNGKKTTKTVAVKGASTQSPELFKVSIVRDKFNPVILLVPVVILLAAGAYIIRPWRFAFAGNSTGQTEVGQTTPPVTSSNDSAEKTSTTAYHKVDAPGTVYSPTPSDDSTSSASKDELKK